MGTDQLEFIISLQFGDDTFRGPDTWKAYGWASSSTACAGTVAVAAGTSFAISSALIFAILFAQSKAKLPRWSLAEREWREFCYRFQGLCVIKFVCTLHIRRAYEWFHSNLKWWKGSGNAWLCLIKSPTVIFLWWCTFQVTKWLNWPLNIAFGSEEVKDSLVKRGLWREVNNSHRILLTG